MFLLTLRAFLLLIYFDTFLARNDFPGLYGAVRRRPRRSTPPTREIAERVCSAVDLACIWYWKHVLCLERSAVTACLLKSHGVAAQLVIGAQHTPFRAHAWVEVDGRVVNDKSYMNELYAVLDRC
jgi:hypothetical protein